ncbi:MAG: UDP-N-acetylmuramate dehydrogenase, partial [Coriobacteriales bacterium]|nr:UDP-N-acetylmuramate dehydrogenase [Coriobacteriales bacterium]
TAQAGATNKQVAEAARDAGLTGYEFASGIPGSIGGAAIMNAGAYDGEFKDVGVSVTCLTLEGEVVTVSAADAQWNYRHSMMSDRGYIVLDATIHLVPFDKDKISARMAELKQRREDKQPLELGSAGSTFKRPIGYYAGKLIQDAGMQGHTVGRAQVSTKHAGFVVNMGGATAADIRQVIVDVQNAVFADAGVHLETEVRMWGFDD